ncbi:DUF6265 family protein [Flavobacterium okayamense]|uniref:DUF6265 domain-containing protein n=1 Tax=Flavobacterium okayamense TaxID=2830782 RepID=A0ABM7S9A4_9FLAO|nr:DUF6265 family protein [Flavobacterium okayamense]BCY27937.1 hypothetical protein KK2020170_08050 [Flavobacterium okayamense]
MKKLLFLIAISIITLSCKAQNTLHYNDEKGSPKANLNDIKWLSGNWKGASEMGNFEENWSLASAKSMLFSFKMWNDNEVFFYEVGHIIEKDKSLVLELKHFDKELKGWEKQDEKESFRLVKIDGNKFYFDKITYEKIDDNHMIVYVLMEETNEELIFNFKK